MTGRTYYLTKYAPWRELSPRFAGSHWAAADPAVGPSDLTDTTAILALIDADEATHAEIEQNTHFTALPHPLSRVPVSDVAISVLAGHGVRPGASTFDVAEAVGRAHPLLRYRVF